MKNEAEIIQPTLFDADAETIGIDRVLLYALGEFQSRGKILAERELALDRLRGAFRRATDKFGLTELSDDKIADGLLKLGANVRRVPSFVAKHPFRVTIQSELANKAEEIYQSTEKG